MNTITIFFKTLFAKNSRQVETINTSSIYDIKINTLNERPVDFSKYKGKYLLIVNVASKCGFTPQYKQLQKLSDDYKKSLVVVGVPCNQFGKQEPGSKKDIQNFCEINYGVTFLITEKINVKGSQTHPLYKWLTNKSQNGVSNSSVKWNFQKYLVNNNGELIDYFHSATSPLSKKITKHL